MSKIKIDVIEASPSPSPHTLQFPESSDIQGPEADSSSFHIQEKQKHTLKVPMKIGKLRKHGYFRSSPSLLESSSRNVFKDLPPEEVKRTRRRNSDLGEIENLLDSLLEPVCVRELHSPMKKEIQLLPPDISRLTFRRAKGQCN